MMTTEMVQQTQETLPLTSPAFLAFTQKIRVRFTGVVAKTIASEMRISSELSDDYGFSSGKLAKQQSVLKNQLESKNREVISASEASEMSLWRMVSCRHGFGFPTL